MDYLQESVENMVSNMSGSSSKGAGAAQSDDTGHQESNFPSEVDIHLIQRILPHRYPFLLVDHVKDIIPATSCVGVKCVTMNEPQFTGHFPGNPVFPGVLIVEALAQSAGVLMGLSLDLIDKNATVYFMSIDKVRFRRKVVPGDVMELHVSVLRGGGKVWKVEGKAMVNGKLACEAEFMALFERPK